MRTHTHTNTHQMNNAYGVVGKKKIVRIIMEVVLKWWGVVVYQKSGGTLVGTSGLIKRS